MLECIRRCLCVCVSGSVCVSWNGVEEPGRGMGVCVCVREFYMLSHNHIRARIKSDVYTTE